MLIAGSWLASGCSVSLPGLGGETPVTTGSITAPVEVERPLPQTLAYSDATTIGHAAAAALWQVDGEKGADWVNSATGSSGTVEDGGAESGTEQSHACRLFSTVVTSLGGVHRYAGKVCREGDGRSVVQIATAEGSGTS